MEKRIAILSVVVGSALIAYGFGTSTETTAGWYLRFAFLFVGFVLITLTYVFYEKDKSEKLVSIKK